MSTAVRILILVGVLVISIISYIISMKIAKKLIDIDKTAKIIPNLCFLGALIICLISLICFPNRVFLAIEKIKLIFYVGVIVSILVTGAYIVCHGLMKKRNPWSVLLIIPVMLIFCIPIVFGSNYFESNEQKCIEETNRTVISETIEEPYITKQAKGVLVKYDENNNIISCKYYSIENDTLEEHEITSEEIEYVVYLENNEESHIEKTETTIDYINHELKPSSKGYSYSETIENYVIFLNKDQVVAYN